VQEHKNVEKAEYVEHQREENEHHEKDNNHHIEENKHHKTTSATSAQAP